MINRSIRNKSYNLIQITMADILRLLLYNLRDMVLIFDINQI